MRRKAGTHIGEAMDIVLGGLESSTKVRESLALAYWPAAAGPQMAAGSEAVSVREGVLFVNTKSSTYSHELSFYKAAIISKLNKRIGHPVIWDIVFRAQGITKAAPAPAPQNPTAEDLAAIVLTPAEQRKLQRELGRLSDISDPGIRRTVARRIEREARLHRWRLDHGWKPCRSCKTLHPIDGDLCPMCRVGA